MEEEVIESLIKSTIFKESVIKFDYNPYTVNKYKYIVSNIKLL